MRLFGALVGISGQRGAQQQQQRPQSPAQGLGLLGFLVGLFYGSISPHGSSTLRATGQLIP